MMVALCQLAYFQCALTSHSSSCKHVLEDTLT